MHHECVHDFVKADVRCQFKTAFNTFTWPLNSTHGKIGPITIKHKKQIITSVKNVVLIVFFTL